MKSLAHKNVKFVKAFSYLTYFAISFVAMKFLRMTIMITGFAQLSNPLKKDIKLLNLLPLIIVCSLLNTGYGLMITGLVKN